MQNICTFGHGTDFQNQKIESYNIKIESFIDLNYVAQKNYENYKAAILTKLVWIKIVMSSVSLLNSWYSLKDWFCSLFFLS